MGGHNAKSIADHKREGTFNATRHRDRLDERDWHTGGMPEMPEGLTPQQKWAWNQVVGNIRAENLAELDTIALMAFSRWFAQWAEAMTEAEETTGKANWTAICRAGMAWKQCKEIMAKFGMTPADRSKFKKAAPSGPTEANPIAALSAMVSGRN